VRTDPGHLRARAVAVALGAALAAAPASVAAAPVPSPTQTVVLPIIADPGSINPLLASDAYGRSIVALLYPSLASYQPSGTLRPLLARSWSTVDRGRTVRLVLRPGLRWSDGAPVDATDVVATFTAMADARDDSPFAGIFRSMQSVTAQGSDTVLITLGRVDPAFVPDVLTVPIAPASVLRPLKGRARALRTAASLNADPTVTAGPFRFAGWNRSTDTLNFVRNAAYPWGRARIDRLVIQYEATNSDAWQAFLSGSVDAAEVPAPNYAQAQALSKAGRLHLVDVATGQYSYLAFNMRDPIWKDARVREAAIYAVDRQAINRQQDQPLDVPTGGPPPLNLASRTGDMAGMAYDPARAAALLDAAGWIRGEGGVRYKAGQPLSFVLETVSGDSAWDNDIGAVAGYLRLAGFQVTLDSVPFHQLVLQLAERPHGVWPGAFALAWDMLPGADARVLFGGAPALPPAGQNIGSYSDTTVADAMNALAAGGLSKADQAKQVRALATALKADPPALFLYQTVGVVALRPGLHAPTPVSSVAGILDWPQDWYWTRG